MKDTFDFTSYVRSGRLHEAYNVPNNLDVDILEALVGLANDTVTPGSEEWDQIVDTFRDFAGLEDEKLTDFLIGDMKYDNAYFSDYMDELGISIDYEGAQEEPHQTTDTFVGPKGIEEMVKEVLKKKLSEIQMGFEYNPKSVTGGGGKKPGPKPIAFPYYELKKKFPEHFRLLSGNDGYLMKVSQKFMEAISGLKAAGKDVRAHQLPTLQDKIKTVTPQTKRVLTKGTEGEKAVEETFKAKVEVLDKEGRTVTQEKDVTMKMYRVNWPVMGPNKTKEFLWLTPTQATNEGITDFQIDEKYLD